jgi:hypothetical protein
MSSAGASVPWRARSHRSHAVRSAPGGKRSQIARRRLMRAARRIASASMPVSVVQPAGGVTTEFRVRLPRYVT